MIKGMADGSGLTVTGDLGTVSLTAADVAEYYSSQPAGVESFRVQAAITALKEAILAQSSGLDSSKINLTVDWTTGNVSISIDLT